MIALTGATGAIGRPLCDRLQSLGYAVIAVGRKSNARWDLREPLSQGAKAVFAQADVIIHCAADIRLAASSNVLFRVNTFAVREIVDFVLTLRHQPLLVHISSAFVQADGERERRNSYENSKWCAEGIVLSSGLRSVIVRPSIVIGSRETGAIGRFSGIYVPIRLVACGILSVVPALRETLVDIIPVDVVVDSIVANMTTTRPAPNIVTVSAGSHAPSLGWLFDKARDTIEQEWKQPLPVIHFVKPDTYVRLFRPLLLPKLSYSQKELVRTLDTFLPYFSDHHLCSSTSAANSDDICLAWERSVRFWANNTTQTIGRQNHIWQSRHNIRRL